MLLVVSSRRADRSKRNPQSQPHSLFFNSLTDGIETARKSSRIDFIFAIFALPSIVDREDIYADVSSYLDQLERGLSIDLSLKGFPGVVNPRGPLFANLSLKNLRSVR